ncbi:PepSY domain-containing protein [Ureibacillus aquaedulcis]|uniref:PepSY domain-containing protein n=1 Tax=Ureibacillus aquaedulcis TaxID=3058421 RepID=A0ABT8GUA1_9BACL|nr:PepSY domain-containing protein [Ureibacillus sp. BA0131]MDN4494911.1 PepSY domain-containing protein [Ureibacillus sp. BA0131]
MTTYTKWMISLVVLMITVTVFVIWLIQDRLFETTEQLTVDEASKLVTDLYGGSVEDFEEKNDIYYMTLLRNHLTYDFQVDSKTGNILQVSSVGNKSPDALTNVKTKDEIRILLKDQQRGTVHSISYKDSGEEPQYIVELTEQETLKTLIVNAITGEILSENIKQQNANDHQTVTIISSEKAKQIALSQLNGSVEYVVYEDDSEGGYYLVEIDGENQEATFQIHAISGKVMSVSDNDDDEDDSDAEEDANDDNDDD